MKIVSSPGGVPSVLFTTLLFFFLGGGGLSIVVAAVTRERLPNGNNLTLRMG
jgi:hypothetical protein